MPDRADSYAGQRERGMTLPLRAMAMQSPSRRMAGPAWCIAAALGQRSAREATVLRAAWRLNSGEGFLAAA